MARPLRLEYPGALYHDTARGNARQDLFRDDEDRRRFLGVMEHVVARVHLVLHAYCLMNNHFHLLVETPEANLSAPCASLMASLPKPLTAVTTGWAMSYKAASRRSSSSGRAISWNWPGMWC